MLSICPLVLAATLSSPVDDLHGTFLVDEENDALVPNFSGGPNPDQAYTQGLRVQSLWELSRSDAKALGRGLTRFHPEADEPDADYPTVARAGFALGQNMYTPADLRVTTLATLGRDRPFGGWSYVGPEFQLVWPASDGSPIAQFTLEIDVGVWGAASLAGATQVAVHSLIRQTKPECLTGKDKDTDDPTCTPVNPRGWHHPEVVIHDGVGVDVTARYETKVADEVFLPYPDLRAKFFGLAECVGGFVYDECGIGVTARAGFLREPRFERSNFPTIMAQDELHMSKTKFDATIPSALAAPPRKWGLWTFGRAEALGVLFNRLIQNEPFVDDKPSAEMMPFVVEAEVGLIGSVGGLDLGGSLLLRSPEILGSVTDGGFHTVGRLRVGLSF